MCSCNQTAKLMSLGATRVLICFKHLHTLSWEILSSVHVPEGHLDLIFQWRKSVLTCFVASRKTSHLKLGARISDLALENSQPTFKTRVLTLHKKPKK